MNETEQNKLYRVAARLRTVTKGDTQFDAVESTLTAARNNYTPYIDLVSFHHLDRTLDNSSIIAYIETEFYVSARHDKDVSGIVVSVIKDLSLPSNGEFFVVYQATSRVTRIDKVSSEWLRSTPFSDDPDDKPLMTCREILTQ